VSRVLLDYVIWDMGQAFDALFGALKSLERDDWEWLPQGGHRSIRAIVGHIASTKLMYDNHAFGDASLTWMDPRFDVAQSPPAGQPFSPAGLVAWLRDADVALRRHVDELASDAELDRPRPVNWGGARATRWILNRLAQHDVFHAGEINHLRALHQRNDRWEWEE
jgi:uncharacterized damage-inducible protein DinB